MATTTLDDPFKTTPQASPAGATPVNATTPLATPAPTPAPSLMDQASNIANTGQYQATTGAFDENKGVEGRVASITSKNSPLMQLAATKARQTANQRGLLNSSMAVGAAQNAVLDAATPIATSDANAYQQQQLANQNALNEAGRANAAARAAAGTEAMRLGENARQFDTAEAGTNRRFDAQLGESSRQFDVSDAGTNRRFDAELANRQDEFTRGQAHDVEMAKLDGDIRANLLGIEAKYKTEIAGNENIANAWGTMMSDISKIQNNPDLDAATKKALIENTINGFQSFTGFWQKATGGAVDVSDLLKFGVNNTGAATPAPAETPAAPAPAAPAPAPAPAQPPADDYWTYYNLGGGGA